MPSGRQRDRENTAFQTETEKSTPAPREKLKVVEFSGGRIFGLDRVHETLGSTKFNEMQVPI
jgi:hypothetical protein